MKKKTLKVMPKMTRDERLKARKDKIVKAAKALKIKLAKYKYKRIGKKGKNTDRHIIHQG